jgi:phenylacetate-CoA ligase
MEDALYPLLNIYKRLPMSFQNVIGRFYRGLPAMFRYGSFYDLYQKRINLFLNGRPDEISLLQFRLLSEITTHALTEVPFWRKMPPVKKIEDFQKWPIVTKTDIVTKPESFISETFSEKGLRANTGGGSGEPMAFFIHAGQTRPKEAAHFDWFWGQCGYSSGDRLLMIRGASLKGNALYQHQSIKNCLAVSCYELNQKNIESVLKEIRKFRPKFVHGYPSAVKNFIHCIIENSKAFWNLPLSGVFLGSEGMTDFDRIQIERFFETRVLTWYGHSECAIMGGNSLESNEFHFFPFYGYAELLDEEDKPIDIPGVKGRIVATSFDNYVMPFIRYDTGDYGTLSANKYYHGMPCLVLSKIDGRAQDLIYLVDGTRVSLTAFIFGQHLPEFSRIREMQLVQDAPGKLLLRIVKGTTFSENDTQTMVKRLERSVSGKIEISCRYVSRIEKTHRGKHRFLVQNIKG